MNYMTTSTKLPELARKSLLRLKKASIVWLPVAKLEVEKAATPLTKLRVPSVVVTPLNTSLNVTVPVGTTLVPALLATVAVNVTACPAVAGLGDAVRFVLVLAGAIVWDRADGDELLVKLAAPR